MIKPKVFALIFLSFYAYSSFAEESPFQFVRYNQSARAAGLAGCFVSMPEDAGAVFFNPATIPTVKDKHFNATFLKHVLDINSGNVAYSKKYDGYGWFGGSVGFTNYGSFDKADQTGQRNGTFSSNDMIFAVTYANELDTNLYYGVTAKFLYANIEKYSSTAFAFDAGLIYMLPDKKTNIGLSILHAGGQITSYNNSNETLPLDIRLGINNRLKGLPLLVNFSFTHLADAQDAFLNRFLNFSLAGELYLGEYVQVRVGYDNQVRREIALENDKKLTGVTGGLGLKFKDFNFDYGLAIAGSSAILHRFTLGLDF